MTERASSRRKSVGSRASRSGVTPIVASRPGAVARLIATPDADGGSLVRARYVDAATGVSSSHGDVLIVTEHGATQKFAIKRQRVRRPHHLHAERAYRELRIAQQLHRLASAQQCANYVQIVEWFKGARALRCAATFNG